MRIGNAYVDCRCESTYASQAKMTDPAFATDSDPTEFIGIDAVPLDASAVYLFDFDGVIASGDEDSIYRLKERPGEREMFSRIEAASGLRTSDIELRYRRHLLFQELALRHQIKIEPGPGFDLAKWASDNARFFILTARSAWAATARVREFLDDHGLRPIDFYQVGRVHKDRQIAQALEEFPQRTVYYVEDSVAHLKRASGLAARNFVPVHCASTTRENETENLYTKVFKEWIDDVD